MYEKLEEINQRPEPFRFYTAEELWNDEYTSKRMLEFHLNPSIDVSSRRETFIEKSVDWICEYFSIGQKSEICDFGCGPGLYTTRLARKGAIVTGIDFSKRSIAYACESAEREHLNIQYENMNYLEFESDKKFDLIIMIMCDFCALGPSQRKSLLKKFNKLLKPEGSVLLDVYSLNAFKAREEQAVYEENLLNGFWAEQKYFGFLNSFKYEKEKVVLDKYTIIEAHRTRRIYNWLQHFSPESLEMEVDANGFKIRNFFADVAGSAFDPELTEFAVVARLK